MLQIHHAEEDRSPSKTYADACWQANPRLSPDWWREALGHTVGKLALDWRAEVFQPEHLAAGCNLILTSPRTAAVAHRTVVALPSPSAIVQVLVTEDPVASVAHPSHMVAWQPGATTPDQRRLTLTHLEEQVKRGEIDAYGLSFNALPTPPLHQWLEDAAQAAETVYGRRKRPSLRLLHAPLDLTNLGLLTAPVTHHKAEAVSTLELASRLGFIVIASPAAHPQNAAPAPEALALLTHIAGQEHALNQQLNGWPQLHGQPLFSVLAHLAAGQTPWPTRQNWQNWHQHLLPQLHRHWQAVAHPQVPAYLQNLENLTHHGESLAAAAEAALHAQLLDDMTPRLPQAQQGLDNAHQTMAILAAIPGVTAVAVAAPFRPASLQVLPDIADIGAVLLA